MFCDPDRYPRLRLDEEERAIEFFPEIKKDVQTFHAITKGLRVAANSELSDAQKLLIYRTYKKLGAMRLESSDKGYEFSLLIHRSGPPARRQALQIPRAKAALGMTISWANC
ncbi:MAG: hypothetical protein L0Z53_14635 [Acidobacteriales bacterium]|nr:hypothetical protein [Terriglobales bacterium]